MMMARLGGKRRPMAPDAVTRDSAFSREYPLPVRITVKRPPRARMVTPDAPVKVVKKVATRTAAITAPPRSQPTEWLTTARSRFPALPSASRYPARVNSGIAAIPLSVRML
jgi:hypothetical protein